MVNSRIAKDKNTTTLFFKKLFIQSWVYAQLSRSDSFVASYTFLPPNNAPAANSTPNPPSIGIHGGGQQGGSDPSGSVGGPPSATCALTGMLHIKLAQKTKVVSKNLIFFLWVCSRIKYNNSS